MKQHDASRQIRLAEYHTRGRVDSSDGRRFQDGTRLDYLVPLGVNVRPGTDVLAGHIIWGDGLAAMAREAQGTYQAIYLDPPFFTQRAPSTDRGGFRDRWESLDQYLAWLRPWLQEARRLLSSEGWCWIHLDWHAVHYGKVLADQVFGAGHFRNEIIWHYTGRRMAAGRRFNQKHDTLLVYARSAHSRLFPVFEPWTREEYLKLKRQQLHVDPDGREWIWGHAGRGRSHAYRIDVEQQVSRGRAVDSVWDLPIINTSAGERTGWPTQKPEALLARVVESSVAPGGLIGDFMAGSGTTAVAAASLGRRFVVAERDSRAIAIIRERLEARGFQIAEPVPFEAPPAPTP
jgi:site-specific DNA-methyltransferase (adenine-specific)